VLLKKNKEPEHQPNLPLFAPRTLLSVHPSGRWMVGAVGIENNNGRDFKDLRGMMGNTKSLKGNDRECKGILIAPLKRPRFSRPFHFLDRWVSPTALNKKSASDPNLAARMASRRSRSVDFAQLETIRTLGSGFPYS
jgi:hypothetical protein